MGEGLTDAAPTPLLQQYMSASTAADWESVGVTPCTGLPSQARGLCTGKVGRWKQVESQLTGGKMYIYQGLQFVVLSTSRHAEFAFFSTIFYVLTAWNHSTHLFLRSLAPRLTGKWLPIYPYFEF
jgi:hypothetical protein